MQPFVPIAQDLWNEMKQAFANISMPLAAHQAAMTIFAQVEREAAERAMRARPAPEGLKVVSGDGASGDAAAS